jgi:RND family efflux transporter MFP subunit
MLLLGLALAFAGCNREANVAETPPMEVIVCQPVPPGTKPELIADVDIYQGNVQSKDTQKVRARVRGHIKKILFTEGDEIKAGTPLFLLDTAPFDADLKQAEGQLKTAQEKLTFAEERIKFYRPLAEKGTVSKEELLKVEKDKGEALGAIDVANGKIMEAKNNIGYCKINAEVDGKVGESALAIGDLVGTGGEDSLLTTVVPMDPMYVYFNINERAYQGYRKILLERAKKDKALNPFKTHKLKIEVDMAVGDDDYKHKGVVDFVDNRVDPNTSSIKVRARFDNPKGADDRRPLTDGSFARIRVSLLEPAPAILVAERAILTDQSLKYVLVANKAKDNLVERIDIKTTSRVQDSGLQAVEGLKGDEWVIVEGVNRVRPGVKADPKEGKMPRRPVR